MNTTGQRSIDRRKVKRFGQKLSPRQMEVLLLSARGLTEKEVALRLKCVKSTVQWHKFMIYRKSGVTNMIEALNFYGTWTIRPEYCKTEDLRSIYGKHMGSSPDEEWIKPDVTNTANVLGFSHKRNNNRNT